MIIRRKHTANYTTIGNALFADERLKADELGVLAYLLSRPHHWEVRRPALQRRFGFGRDLMRRILRNLIQFGWVRAEIARRPNGTVVVAYEVRDEPGPELTADEARSALSLASSDAGPGESCDEGMADESAPEPGSEIDPDPPDPPAGYGSPPTGQPVAAGRLRLSPPGILEKNESVRTELENPRPDFCAIGENAGRIADALLAAKSLPPDVQEAIGLRYQVQAWLNAGIAPDFLMAVATRVIGKRPAFPHLNYLDKTVRGAWDDHRALPAASPSPREKPHETSRSVIAAADRALDRLAAEIERRSAAGSGVLSEGGSPAVRTIPPAGSG